MVKNLRPPRSILFKKWLEMASHFRLKTLLAEAEREAEERKGLV